MRTREADRPQAHPLVLHPACAPACSGGVEGRSEPNHSPGTARPLGLQTPPLKQLADSRQPGPPTSLSSRDLHSGILRSPVSPSVEFCLPRTLCCGSPGAGGGLQPHLLVADHAIHAGLLLVQLRCWPSGSAGWLPSSRPRQQLHLLLQLPHLPLGLQPVPSPCLQLLGFALRGRSACGKGQGPGALGTPCT